MSSNRVISGWLRRAEKLLTNGELKGADALFSDALKKDKKSVTALRGRANVAQASGSNEHAKKFSVALNDNISKYEEKYEKIKDFNELPKFPLDINSQKSK